MVQTVGCKVGSRIYCQHKGYNQYFVITVNGK